MRTVFFSLLMFCLPAMYAQNTYFHWISTGEDEFVRFISPYGPDRILAGIMQGEYATGYIDLFNGYHNLLVEFDYDLEVLKTATLNKVNGWEVILSGVIDVKGDTLVLWGRALNGYTLDHQLVVFSLDNEWNIADYHFYGDSLLNEYVISGVKDANGDYIFLANTSLDFEEGEMVFFKTGSGGGLIHYSVDSEIDPKPKKIIDTDEDTYYLSTLTGLYKTDTDFNILEYSVAPDSLTIIPADMERLADGKYATGGTFMAPPVPGSPFVIDAGYSLYSQDFELLSETSMGASDTTDFGKFLAVSGLDTLYIGANKNFTNNPVQESWISVYQRQDTTGIREWHTGGDYQFDFINSKQPLAAGSLEALNNGGFIAGAQFWDFVSYPGSDFQRDVIIFSVNYGDTLVGTNPPPVYQDKIFISPQPVVNKLNISRSCSGMQLIIYDGQGKPVLHKTIDRNATLDIGYLPSGIYFYRFIKENRTFQTGKILKK